MLANHILYVHLSADLGLLLFLRVRKTLQRRLGKLGIMVIRAKSVKKSTLYGLSQAWNDLCNKLQRFLNLRYWSTGGDT
jgi:hypothetical protein